MLEVKPEGPSARDGQAVGVSTSANGLQSSDVMAGRNRIPRWRISPL